MFTHLHVHTQYSLLDGMSRIPDLVKRARELGMTSLAITDHGAMYGAVEFYHTAKAAGIKPVIGCEVYLAPDSRTNHTSDKSNYHLILLARDQTGYRNLLQLVTRAHFEGFYYKPRVDKELLQQHHEGLIALSACIAGEIPRLILEGRADDAAEAALWYHRTFGDFYLEVQRQPLPELERVNQVLIPMASSLGVPLVATNDVHYVAREDASAHDLLLCIGTNSTVTDPRRMKMAGDYFYLKSEPEMAELYQDIPQALENTQRIADSCNLELEFGRIHLPDIELPAGKSADEYLADLCRENLDRCYPNPTEEIKNRLDYELDVIHKTQFANYFLVVWDIISFAKRQKILYGVRGSAAASIVLYCLGITEIDPLEHRLVFERFLNIERREMPDIDLDFQDDRRDEVIAYVSQRFGRDHVAQIITFGTLGARAAIRDVGRALGMSYGDVDRVARLVPFAVNMTLDRAMEENAELRTIYEQDEVIKKLIDSARRVEGIARHASTHAAGVVISRDELTRHVPLQRVSRGDGGEFAMTQFSMDDIARIGLLKMDFLGLINLNILGKAREIILQNRGIEIDLHRLPLGDKKTYDLLSSGETAGVFQLEGGGMRRHIKDLKPSTFSDIAAMVALYRPGPMQHIPTFIEAKHGRAPIHYPHPALEPILAETYGVIVYQEQVLFIVRALAGYSLGQADIFRKAMGKKIPEVMKKERANFLAGAKRNSFSAEIASTVFDLIEPFAGYAFNKAHATSYALVAYQTAYLKANYPIEYMTALLMCHAGQTEKAASAIAECRRLGVPVFPPDINHSQASFSIEKKPDGSSGIRYGLAAIKNVGEGAVAPLIRERERGGVFRSIEDFCRRADSRTINRRVMESLIKAGALDSLGERGTLLGNLERVLSLAQREQKLRETGQATMFDLWGEAAPPPLPALDLENGEVSFREKLAWEKELMGVYLSDHPLSAVAARKDAGVTLCGQIEAEMAGQVVRVVGMVASLHELMTRDRRPFISAILEDLDGQVEVMVWPQTYAETRELWLEGNLLEVVGRVKVKDDQVQLGCDRVSIYEPAKIKREVVNMTSQKVERNNPEPTPKKGYRLVISIVQTQDEETDIAYLHKIVGVIKTYPGNDEITLRVLDEEKVFKMKLPNTGIRYCPELHQKLVEMVGEEGLEVQPLPANSSATG